jgi:hypothetical protein
MKLTRTVGTVVIWSIALSILVGWSAPAQTAQQETQGGAKATSSAGPNAEAARNRAAFELSRVDKKLVDQFQKAWLLAKNGTSNREAVILIFRSTEGRYTGKTLAITNEQLQLSFKWDPAAIAIVHTHPNHCDPAPGRYDRQLADRLSVPIFTITRSGMFMYDPATKLTRKVQNGLDWLNSSNFFYGAPQSL